MERLTELKRAGGDHGEKPRTVESQEQETCGPGELHSGIPSRPGTKLPGLL